MCLKNSKHQWLHSQQWLKLANSRPLLLPEGDSLDHLRRASWASTSSFVAGPWDEAAVTGNSVTLRARHQGPAVRDFLGTESLGSSGVWHLCPQRLCKAVGFPSRVSGTCLPSAAHQPDSLDQCQYRTKYLNDFDFKQKFIVCFQMWWGNLVSTAPSLSNTVF